MNMEIIGEIYTGINNINLSPWKFKLDWETLKKEEMKEFIQIADEVNVDFSMLKNYNKNAPIPPEDLEEEKNDSENKQNPIPNAKQSNISIQGNNELEHEELKNKKHDRIIFNTQKKADKKKDSSNTNISINSNHSNLYNFIMNHENNNINNINEKNNNKKNLKIIVDDKRKRSVSNTNINKIIDNKEKSIENKKLNEIKKVIFDLSKNENKEEKEKMKFERKKKKTKTLVEKSRLESKFQEELIKQKI